MADVKDELASNIGSANTLCLKDGKIYAYNTDALGFLEAIKEFESINKALILGAGGTALALAFALKQKGVEVCVANRSEKDLRILLYIKPVFIMPWMILILIWWLIQLRQA